MSDNDVRSDHASIGRKQAGASPLWPLPRSFIADSHVAGRARSRCCPRVLLAAVPAHAVPAFGTQTGQSCQACHIGGFGPQLTQYGRAFKLGGYTQRAGKWNVPLSVMAIGSFTYTRADQNPPPTPDYASNHNIMLDQVSPFLAGGVGNHFGGFVQVTYDGVGRTRSWDNLNLRAVTTATVLGKDAVFGLSLNNSPGVQDVRNTLPAWGYPYTGSSLAPSPTASPLFAGGLAQPRSG